MTERNCASQAPRAAKRCKLARVRWGTSCAVDGVSRNDSVGPREHDRGVMIGSVEAGDGAPPESGRGIATLLDLEDPLWGQDLAQMSHDVYHAPRYSALDARRVGGQPVAYSYRDQDDLLILPLVLRDIPETQLRDAISAYGFPGPISTRPPDTGRSFWDEAIKALVPTLASAGIVSCFVRLHPLLPVPLETLRDQGTLVEHGRTVAIDLGLSAEERWRNIRANHRRQITSALSSGVTIRFDEWSDLGAFIDAYYENMRYVNAQALYFFEPEYFHSLHAELGDAAHLVTAELGGVVVAGALIFECGGIVQYHLGATRTDHRDKQPIKAIIHRISEWAATRGNRFFHLGGGLGGHADSLFHFKAGFSPTHVPFHTWRVISDRDAYAVLMAHTTVASLVDDPLFFPGYRRTP